MLEALKRTVRALLERRRRATSAAQRSEAEPHVTQADLVAGLQGLGIIAGDVVFIHSSLKSLGFVPGGPAEVIAALQEAVGQDGTLILPTYYQPGGTIQRTCELPGYEFDIRKHGTSMGRLPEAFLRTPGIARSLHPTHSVAAWGRHAAFLTEAHHLAPSVFGEGSPWQRFAELPRAKVLGLGVSMGPITFYHLLEDRLGHAFPESVWQDRQYELPCIDAAGERHLVPVRAYRPELMARRIDHPSRADLRTYFAAEFDRAGLRRVNKVGSAEAWTISAPAFLRHLEAMSAQGFTIYTSPEQLDTVGARTSTTPISGA